jgi:hypothetical protein
LQWLEILVYQFTITMHCYPDFVYTDSLALGDDARNQAIANAQVALKALVAQGWKSIGENYARS